MGFITKIIVTNIPDIRPESIKIGIYEYTVRTISNHPPYMKAYK